MFPISSVFLTDRRSATSEEAPVNFVPIDPILGGVVAEGFVLSGDIAANRGRALSHTKAIRIFTAPRNHHRLLARTCGAA